MNEQFGYWRVPTGTSHADAERVAAQLADAMRSGKPVVVSDDIEYRPFGKPDFGQQQVFRSNPPNVWTWIGWTLAILELIVIVLLIAAVWP